MARVRLASLCFTNAEAPKVLDNASRARQLRHHLESLERDNFVALNEYEAIIATAAAAASVPGPATLNAKPLQDLEAVGSIVGGVVGTLGSSLATPAASPGRYKGKAKKGTAGSGTGTGVIGAGSFGTSGDGGVGGAMTDTSVGFRGHRKPALPKKPLSMLLDESGIADYGPDVPTYLNVNMGPSRCMKFTI
ncbi:hypothetical protein BGZ58_010127 [Dissophora ornata]|nr:hypothetical protein BGZ58_010127 [Dissophora ornata]